MPAVENFLNMHVSLHQVHQSWRSAQINRTLLRLCQNSASLKSKTIGQSKKLFKANYKHLSRLDSAIWQRLLYLEHSRRIELGLDGEQAVIIFPEIQIRKPFLEKSDQTSHTLWSRFLSTFLKSKSSLWHHFGFPCGIM